MMQRTLHLFSISLALLMFGCGTESTEAPLVPEILSISIVEANATTPAYALYASTIPRAQLNVNVIYSDKTETLVTEDLNWVAKSGLEISSDLVVVNGLVFVARNRGDVNVTASFRKKFITKNARVHVIPLSTISHISAVADSNQVDINNSSEGNITVPTGESIKLEASGIFADGKTITNINEQINWILSDYTIATINPATGQLNVLKEGLLDVNVSIFSEINASVKLNIIIE